MLRIIKMFQNRKELKNKSKTKKLYLNRDIYRIISTYLITELHNLQLDIQSIKSIIKTNIKLDYITKEKKYGLNIRNFCRIIQLMEKYNYYNWEYCNDYKNEKQFCPHPILLDALFSGCDFPLAYSSHKYFNNDIFSDIREIIYLIPGVINSDFGQIRCRNEVTPLYAACINFNVPLKVIDFLLSKGANKNHKIKVNGEKIDILSDIEDNISIVGNERYEKIKQIFLKY